LVITLLLLPGKHPISPFINVLLGAGSGSFVRSLRSEIRDLPLCELPLNRAVSQSRYIDDSGLEVYVFHAAEDEHTIQAR